MGLIESHLRQQTFPLLAGITRLTCSENNRKYQASSSLWTNGYHSTIRTNSESSNIPCIARNVIVSSKEIYSKGVRLTMSELHLDSPQELEFSCRRLGASMGKVRESVADAVIHDLATLASCAAVSRI